MAGAEDVLIAYPVQGPKVNRVLNLIKKFPKTQYRFLLDNVNCAKEIQKKCQINGLSVEVYIDVNNGQNRTGIKIEFIRNLIDQLGNFTNITVVGLHCYDGHIRMASLEDRTQTCRSAFEKVLKLQEDLQSVLKREINLVAGGSPSFSVHAKHHKVECSPGTFIFWDQRYANDYKEQAFKKAAVVATRVISKLDAHTYCLDLGHKSVASEFPFPRVAFIDAPELTQVGHSEEHLILKSKEPDVLEAGQLLLAYPFHVCPTVALYDHVHVVRNGKIIDQWEVIARNRKITI
jgi:D-serine deaminase-like pyridoxal phosphate-dependent protein